MEDIFFLACFISFRYFRNIVSSQYALRSDGILRYLREPISTIIIIVIAAK